MEHLPAPSKVRDMARHQEKQNLRFRAFLLSHAEAGELDARFLQLHKEVFSGYDCCRCNNCCKEYFIIVDKAEISPIARYIDCTEDDFVSEHLMLNNGQYTLLERPCEFIEKDGRCRTQACKPAVCRGFPYTDQPDRLASMYSILNSAETCPVVYGILQRLKAIYGFSVSR